MTTFNTYLNFAGNTREAMTFYKDCLGAELEIMPFGDATGNPADKDLVMHAMLKKGDACIMASDPMPGMPVTQGNNFFININCDTRDEQDRYWAALGDGATITMPLADQFWGARFGMLTDKFGIGWMFNCYAR